MSVEPITPELALEAIREAPAGQLLVLDLDETLLLRNSTELFLDQAQPKVVISLLLWVMDSLKPWRLVPKRYNRQAVQDWMRIRMVQILDPGSLRRWHGRCQEFGNRFLNLRLAEALPPIERNPRLIATLGFREIVTPLLEAHGLGDVRVVACDSLRDRRVGKHVMLATADLPAPLNESLVITDSQQDRELLAEAATGLYVKWPDAVYRRAGGRIYLPFFYTTRVKHPNQSYLRRGVVEDDWLLWLLASAALWTAPIHTVLGSFGLLVSFWAIYEFGYLDNDRIADSREADPVLSEAYKRRQFVAPPIINALAWAIGGAVSGIWILGAGLDWAPEDHIRALALWSAVLIGGWLLFRGYNRLNKQTRQWVFPLLQTLRTGSFLLLAGVHAAGLLAALATIWMRSTQYFLYRAGVGYGWPALLPRTYLYVMLLGAGLFLPELRPILLDWPSLILLAWCLMRARGELRQAIPKLGRLRP